MSKDTNLTLVELIIGTVVYGIIAQLVTIVLTSARLGRPLYYSIGLWIGIIGAVLLALHMNHTIIKAVEAGEAGAEKTVKMGAILRYIVICIFMLVVAFADISSPVMVFVGFMGLKIGAYLQPITHGVLRKCGPSEVRTFIKADDERRQQLLKEYEQEQARLEEEKKQKTLEEQNSLNNLGS